MFTFTTLPHYLLRTRQKGFSLLELLVVVSIIGILIAITSVAYSTAQKKGRDSKRRADVKAMQSAFEQYNASNSGSYDSVLTNCTGMASLGANEFLPGGLPVDPKGVAYTCTNTAAIYCICTPALETGGGNSATADCSALGAASPTNSYFCAKNLQ